MKRSGYVIEEMKNAFGGTGTLILKHWLAKNELIPNLIMAATVVLPPGVSAGDHFHHGEAEIYLIIKGKGYYVDNGEKVDIKENDVFVCYDGESHGIVNTGDTDLEMIAIIIKGS